MAAIAYPLKTQQEEMWCWAAVAESVEHYFSPDSNVQQCGIAGEVFGAADSCLHPDDYNAPKSLEEALIAIGHLREVVDGPLSFEELKDELDNDRPVCARIGWRPRGGHFVVVEGYRESDGEQWVSVADPRLPHSMLPYTVFRDAYYFGAGRWTHTYLVGEREAL